MIKATSLSEIGIHSKKWFHGDKTTIQALHLTAVQFAAAVLLWIRSSKNFPRKLSITPDQVHKQVMELFTSSNQNAQLKLHIIDGAHGFSA